MQNGDISNEVPPRLMVNYDIITEDAFTTVRTFGFKTGIATRRVFEPVTLNALWRYTSRSPVRLELVNFGVDDATAQGRLDDLDRTTVNPFNLSTAWHDVDHLLRALPYRPDVIGVMDIPERQSMYGLRGIGLDHLDRMV